MCWRGAGIRAERGPRRIHAQVRVRCGSLELRHHVAPVTLPQVRRVDRIAAPLRNPSGKILET